MARITVHEERNVGNNYSFDPKLTVGSSRTIDSELIEWMKQTLIRLFLVVVTFWSTMGLSPVDQKIDNNNKWNEMIIRSIHRSVGHRKQIDGTSVWSAGSCFISNETQMSRIVRLIEQHEQHVVPIDHL